MLRLKAATSAPEEFTSGGWRPVIADQESPDPAGVTRVVLTAGKVHYDLETARDKAGDTATAIVRVEQLAPLPVEQILAELDRFGDAKVTWAQQEPANQGAWPFMALNLAEHLGDRKLHRASRPASASPATGSGKRHERELETLLAQAMDR
jgi:2-oxoglutarate dehydrogenase E1 component